MGSTAPLDLRCERSMEKKTRFSLIYVIIALFGVMFLHDMWVGYRKVATLPYSEFQALLDQDKVSEVVITSHEIGGELKEPMAGGKKEFVTVRVAPEIAAELQKHNVK